MFPDSTDVRMSSLAVERGGSRRPLTIRCSIDGLLAPLSEDPPPNLLADRIGAGQAGAEDELVRRYSPGVNRILRRATGNDRSLVDDLHQETFQVAIMKLRRGELRDPCRLPGFIASLARNLACEHFRRRLRFVDLKGDDMGAPASGPLDLLLADERSRRIGRVLQALSSRDREVLGRFYLHADSKERICQDLGLDSLQFNRILFRARRRCRNLYERSSRDEESVSAGPPARPGRGGARSAPARCTFAPPGLPPASRRTHATPRRAPEQRLHEAHARSSGSIS
jgi:RNA polymerase sigma-70 factor (ECF subfamily)